MSDIEPTTTDNNDTGPTVEAETTLETTPQINATKEQENSSETASNKNEPASYSTRGRGGADTEPLERILETITEKTPTNYTSFLSETLTEEERRTRTRYIPEVEGMHALKKQQIKGDIALARATPAAPAAKKNRRGGGANNTDAMEVDGDTGAPEEDANSYNDLLRSQGARIVSICDSIPDLLVPCPAYVLPPTDNQRQPTPRESEAVTAFNPPRPQESIGAKKKHRMLRWERRPSDMEVDLTTYRKTVERTRQELKDVEYERNRVKTVDNHMRRHYLQHIKCLDEEMRALVDEIAVVQQQCVQEADLMSSRTRTRGAGKTASIMKDVLAVLHARGLEIEQRGLAMVPRVADATKGVGGVGALSFGDWNRATDIQAGTLAGAWILPGDLVETPLGMGEVASVLGVETLNPPKATTVDAIQSDDIPSSVSPTAATNASLLAPRVAVKLPFGIGYFPLQVVTPRENPTMYNNSRLAHRWKGLLETAAAVGDTLDVEAMADIISSDVTAEGENAMEIDGTGATQTPTEPASCERLKRLLPFGAGMLPSSQGRGGLLEDDSVPEIDMKIHNMLYKSTGVLGSPENQGVPERVRSSEDARQERLVLEAQVRHLRNKLYRQRKIRILNEKTEAANQERAVKVETLVSEMRADMKSLKKRLAEDIRELGITAEKTDSILKTYYDSLDMKFSGEASPSKRPRKETKMEDEAQSEDDMVSTDNQPTDLSDLEFSKQ